jgi:F-type H+-transporting ATPase subunit epsilon
MRLVIATPEERVVDEETNRISAEGAVGSFTLLPKHIDYVTAVRPGIVTFNGRSGERYAAVDLGVLVKEGPVVRVACRHAVVGDSLETLEGIVRERFLALEDRERAVRAAFARLEAEFVRHMMEL